MPSHDTKAIGELFEKLDCNGVTIKKWAKIHDKSSIWSMLCNKTVAVDHSGTSQVNHHAGSGSHSLKSKTRFSSDQPEFEKIGNNIKFCSKHCKQDISKQNVFGNSKLPNKTGVFALVAISTHFSIVCFLLKFPRSFL